MSRPFYITVLLISLTCNTIAMDLDDTMRQERRELATAPKAQKIDDAEVRNLYLVSKDLYRSEQPTRKGFVNLKNMGIKSVVNLRKYHTDNDDAEGLDLNLFAHKMSAGNITEKDIEECLRIIKRAPKPVLVHCMHGSDRTGTIVAAYRILEQGWSPDDAIAELKEPRFGYHSNVYPYIPNLLKGIDWKDMKKRLRDNR